MNKTQAVKELSQAMFACFSEYEGTDNYEKLHSESFVDRKLKSYFNKGKYGKSEIDYFKELDAFDEKVWKDAWFQYDFMCRERGLRKND